MSNKKVFVSSCYDMLHSGHMPQTDVGIRIMNSDLGSFAEAYKTLRKVQIAIFPSIILPGVQKFIDKYASSEDVLAWKMAGVGGALVCKNAQSFPKEATSINIKRNTK